MNETTTDTAFIIEDWTGKRLYADRTFDTFEDGWGFIYENVKDEDNAYDDLYVVKAGQS